MTIRTAMARRKTCMAVVLSALLTVACSGSGSGNESNAGSSVNPNTSTNTNTGNTPQENNIPDSSQATTIPVTFNITVPKYSSNELQVRVQWAGVDEVASWVKDESWTVTMDLPTATENQLVVSFTDGNGAIALGRAEQLLKTNSSGSQQLNISASQFATKQFDGDNDGVSNLDELLQGTNPLAVGLATAVQPSYELPAPKTIRINWSASENAEFYRVLVNADGVSGFHQVSDDIDAAQASFDHVVALYDMVNASYIVQACNEAGCVDSDELQVSGTLAKAVGYFKSSNSGRWDRFGSGINISADGKTFAVGAPKSISGDDNNNQYTESGIVYVFAFIEHEWVQQAYVRASNSASRMDFGIDVALSADGNTLVVGAFNESRAGSGVNPESTERLYESGAAYVFVRNAGVWTEQAYLKASNPGRIDHFGVSVAISADGNTVAVGAHMEGGMSAGINGDQTNIDTNASGAVYMFERNNNAWQQQTYIKASNPDLRDFFAAKLSLSADGKTLAVSATAERSKSTGINGDQTDNSVRNYHGYGLGAVYLFRHRNSSWFQEAYIKASNGEEGDRFGSSVDLSEDGNVLVVGAFYEDSAAVGVNGSLSDNSAEDAGAAYVFEFTNGNWTEQAYLKASNSESEDNFGASVSISDDGKTIVVGAYGEDSAARGINDRQDSETDYRAGAAYLFTKQSGAWQQKAYIKARNTDGGDWFGTRVELSGDGKSLIVSSILERSNATGINGDMLDNSLIDTGAVYLY